MSFRVLILVTVAICTACLPIREKDSTPRAVSAAIESLPVDRIIRLTMPPTLKAADPHAQAQKISDEQKQAIAELRRISDKIKVIFRYSRTFNGLYIIAPRDAIERLDAKFGGSREGAVFQSPMVSAQETSGNSSLNLRNSVNFLGDIGTEQGHGIKVGIVDTGVDYTHRMFQPPMGSPAFADNNPSVLESGSFPTERIVGGIDLVGTDYDSSGFSARSIFPQPDPDPMDEQGHGTHVAGTIGGIGDGESTYSGVAKAASLYAIKVFGKNGSTSEGVLIAALEYAVDPNGDFDIEDRLDILNFSLGRSYHLPGDYFDEAMENFVSTGSISVRSAGNSGDKAFIVGPATSEISVAASTDHTDHVWQFPQIKSVLEGTEPWFSRMEFSYFRDFSASIQGRGVFVDFGSSIPQGSNRLIAVYNEGSYSEEKERRKQLMAAGFKAAVAVARGRLLPYLGSPDDDLHVVAVGREDGIRLMDAIQQGEVELVLNSKEKFEKRELIDRITHFSSRGPRGLDGILKPEITAPGLKIISAKMGGGSSGIKMSGTSMAAPHVAGAVAILRRRHPTISPEEIKSLLTSTAKVLEDHTTEEAYPSVRQGAGRIRLAEALHSKLSFDPAILSFGILPGSGHPPVKRLKIRNISRQTVRASLNPSSGLKISATDLSLAADEVQSIEVTMEDVVPPGPKLRESEGQIVFRIGEFLQRVPSFAVVAPKHSVVGAMKTETGVNLYNSGDSGGSIYLLNEIERTPGSARQQGNPCELRKFGYRLIGTKLILGFALSRDLTSWHVCEVSVLVDRDFDREADLELLAGDASNLRASWERDQGDFATTWLDIRKVKTRVQQMRQSGDRVTGLKEAIVNRSKFSVWDHSGVGIMEVDVDELGSVADNKMRIKIVAVNSGLDRFGDDYFLASSREWFDLEYRKSVYNSHQPNKVDIEIGGQRFIPLTHDPDLKPLLLAPGNSTEFQVL